MHNTKNKIIFWGATGQAVVLEELLHKSDFQLVALFDNRKIKSPFESIPIYYGKDGLLEWLRGGNNANASFLVSIGGNRGKERLEIHNMLNEQGLRSTEAIHRTAYIAYNAEIGSGCQVLANATVCARVKMGVSVIINTSASVDHECILGNGVHIGPGARIAGNVKIGDFTFIGTGAIVLPNLNIGNNSIIGAGAVVTKDMPDSTTVFGNPAKPKIHG